MSVVTRFAPSPTGPLHLGHAYAADMAHRLARAAGGRYLVRIEDIDRQRSKPQWEAALLADLDWLGLAPDAPPLRQSEQSARYEAALDRLWQQGLLYPCTCTRRDIEAALSAPQEGVPLHGPDGPVYPGTCRPAGPADNSGRSPDPGSSPSIDHSAGASTDHSIDHSTHASTCDSARPNISHITGARPRGAHLRLNLRRALDLLARAPDFDPMRAVWFHEDGLGPAGEQGEICRSREALLSEIGDIVVARRDFGTSYHLSVVVDDAAQGITLVSRGNDLFEATPIHALLQRLLGLKQPRYHHHALVRDAQGKRLAKRDDARAIALYRAEGMTPEQVLDLARQGAA